MLGTEAEAVRLARRAAEGSLARVLALAPLHVSLSDAAAVHALFAPLARLPREIAGIAYFGEQGGLLGLRHVAGSRDRLVLPVRAITIDALSFDAWSVVMAHNHPAGDARPSEADLTVTRSVSRGLEAIGIRLIDHLVLAKDETVSLRALGYL